VSGHIKDHALFIAQDKVTYMISL